MAPQKGPFFKLAPRNLLMSLNAGPGETAETVQNQLGLPCFKTSYVSNLEKHW
jgi:hypothetical protein